MTAIPSEKVDQTECAKMPSYELAKTAIREYAAKQVCPVNAKVAELLDLHAPAIAVWLSDRFLLSLLQQQEAREVTKQALARAMHEESEDRHSLPYKWEEITPEYQQRWEDRAGRIMARLPRPAVSLVGKGEG